MTGELLNCYTCGGWFDPGPDPVAHRFRQHPDQRPDDPNIIDARPEGKPGGAWFHLCPDCVLIASQRGHVAELLDEEGNPLPVSLEDAIRRIRHGR